MDSLDSTFPDYGPIPEELWSAYGEAPFTTCASCGKELGPRDTYEIQKVSNRRETVFEIAICVPCGLSLGEEYSRESIAAISAFIAERLNMSREDGLCSLCGRPLAEAHMRSVCGVCMGQQLIMPIVRVCDRCEEEMQEVVSEKTRRAHEDFINRTVPGVPADLDLAPTLFF